MDEFELLKKHWKNQEYFPQISKSDLHKMIKRSSSNTLKWMIAANIFELFVLITFGIIFRHSEPTTFVDSHPFIRFCMQMADYVLIGLPVFFSIIYIAMIMKIQVSDSIAGLATKILQARRLLNTYIYLNIGIFVMVFLYSVGMSIRDYQIHHWNEDISNTMHIIIIGLSSIITLILTIGMVWLFYKLLYGRLLRRLKRNLHDLDIQS